MTPTLRDGDAILVLVGARARPGDIVLARFRDLPDRFVVKRALRRVGDGWWLASDNPFAGGDSGAHGAADVSGRVLLRWPAGGWWPRRLSGQPPSAW
ncbi:MAG: S24 family peptidase [Actinomycetia bacterium]|nr:S24 family peptidase [Actinomycetes bacterium]